MNNIKPLTVRKKRKVKLIDEATTSNSESDCESDLEKSTSESDVMCGDGYELLNDDSDAKKATSPQKVSEQQTRMAEDSQSSLSSDSQQTKIEKMQISLSDEQLRNSLFDYQVDQLNIPDGKKSRSASFTLVENTLFYKNPNQIDPFMLRRQRRGSAFATNSRKNSIEGYEHDLRHFCANKLLHQSTNSTDDLGVFDIPRKVSAPLIYTGYDFNRKQMDNLDKPTGPATISNGDNTLPVPSRSFEISKIEGPKQIEFDGSKCEICKNIYVDPRVLDCLHTFCLQCLVDLDDGKSSINYWRKLSESSDTDWHGSHTSIADSINDMGMSLPSASPEHHSSNSLKYRRSSSAVKHPHKEKNPQPIKERSASASGWHTNKFKSIICPKCELLTEIPVGGIYRLPINFVVMRKIELIVAKATSEAINTIWCNLCSTKIPSTHFCLNCRLNLCNFCKDAHKRQKITQNHQVKTLVDIRQSGTDSGAGKKIMHFHQCQIHPNYELKMYCTTCHQVICNDCTVVLHRSHKFISTAKASKIYMKLVKESLDKSKPMCTYTMHSISKLNDISKKINQKCEVVQGEVEIFLAEYFEALDVHRRTLLNQIARARENKMESIAAQKMDLEKRSSETKSAITFTEELLQGGSDIEALTFVSILLKRFQFCQQSQTSLDVKITDSLQFLPEVKAPSNKAQNNIPLYGIITTQIASAKHCTLETTEGLMNLRVHRKAELVLLSKDKEDRQMCHGGLVLSVDLKYKDGVSRSIPTQVSDKRDGTYLITFVPDISGLLKLQITINEKHIKDSPFILRARKLRPHTGKYHCCTFCSSSGSKTATCACNGVMPGGYKGCGHGHDGHPGQRHWSCCANVMENSECTTANAFSLQMNEEK